jgi:hypothetical protein
VCYVFCGQRWLLAQKKGPLHHRPTNPTQPPPPKTVVQLKKTTQKNNSIITQLRYHEDLMKEFFAASIGVSDAMCPPDARVRGCVVFGGGWGRMLLLLLLLLLLNTTTITHHHTPTTTTTPPPNQANPNCAVCVFPAFSTLISAAFGAVYLLSLWAVTGAIAAAAINATLSRRIRALQVGEPAVFCGGVCADLFFCMLETKLLSNITTHPTNIQQTTNKTS